MSVTLNFYNTLTRTKEPFAPIDPARVRMYVCGPTVYDYAHIGNGRAAIVFDLLFRLLRQVYGADHVIYARNVTDVDDKINARAARDFPDLPLNAAIAQVTSLTLAQYREDVAALGCLPPTSEPRATEHMAEMRALIERLVKRGVAYVAEDHALFSPVAMDALKGAPRYGALARRSLDEMLAGARIDVAPYKRDPMDFVLWKPSKPGEPSWESPAGIAAPGRPGWHIECSAMAMKSLLEPFGGGLACEDADKNLFDIHGGGVDLVFPHHENEIAQSCCAFGSARMANVWMHNGFLQVEGEKMSKSLGNFVTMHDLLRTPTFGGREWPGAALRLAMLRSHYRQPIDWTVRALEEAEKTLQRFARIAASAPAAPQPTEALIAALSDDLNTSAAIAHLHALANEGAASALRADAAFLGLDVDPTKLSRHFTLSAESGIFSVTGTDATLFVSRGDGTFETDLKTQQKIDDLITRRKSARKAKDFAEADKIRGELGAIGIAIKDNKDGTTTWEPKR